MASRMVSKTISKGSIPFRAASLMSFTWEKYIVVRWAHKKPNIADWTISEMLESILVWKSFGSLKKAREFVKSLERPCDNCNYRVDCLSDLGDCYLIEIWKEVKNSFGGTAVEQVF